jgi:phosphate transport system substrate-binding protein
MRFGSRQVSWLLMPALVVGTVALGTSAATAGGNAKANKLASATLNEDGSTFQLAFQQEASARFHKKNPGVTVNVAPGGSGKGRTDFTNQVVDFAGTDGLFKPTDPAPKGGPYDYIPFVAGPITVSYNLSSVKGLLLSPDTVAKIFSRQIKTWDAREIKQDNPKATLPSTAITVAHRSDSSGTTQNLTQYLTTVSPTIWTFGAGPIWPTQLSDTQAGNGNAGVANIVKSTDGAVGYVDFSDARAAGLTFASVKNSAGKFIAPSVAATTAALQGVKLATDGTYNPLNSPNAKAYPITSPTWMLVYQTQTDPAKGAALKAYLTFILTDGQKFASSVDFAPLPPSFVKATQARVNAIKA